MVEFRILCVLAIVLGLGIFIGCFYLLGFSSLVHTPIPFSIIVMGSILISSTMIFSIAFIQAYLSRKALNQQHFFLILAVLFLSFEEVLFLMIRRFSLSLSGEVLVFLTKMFNFLYIEIILLILLSLLIMNLKFNRSALLFIGSLAFSGLIAKVAPIGYSKSAHMDVVFAGGRVLLPVIGLSLSIIGITIYCIDLMKIKMNLSITFLQVLFFLLFLFSFHSIFIIDSIVVIVLASFLMIISLQIFLKSIFVHTL